MRIAFFLCLALALLLAGFSWWGLSTEAGRHAYDEMAGMIPFAAGLASPLFLIGAGLAWWRIRRGAGS